MSTEGIEDKDDPIDKIYYNKYYDLEKLELTDKFDYDFEQTLLRLASDPVNDSLSLLEGPKSILLNYLKGNEIDDAQDIDEMVMTVFSLKTLRGHIRKR